MDTASQTMPGGDDTFKKVIIAVFFAIFVIGASVIAGYIVSFVTALTGVIAMGWIAAVISFTYFLHTGLLTKAYTSWMSIASKIGSVFA